MKPEHRQILAAASYIVKRSNGTHKVRVYYHEGQYTAYVLEWERNELCILSAYEEPRLERVVNLEVPQTRGFYKKAEVVTDDEGLKITTWKKVTTTQGESLEDVQFFGECSEIEYDDQDSEGFWNDTISVNLKIKTKPASKSKSKKRGKK